MSKKKTTNPAATLAKMNSAFREQAVADWRRWACEIASGGALPDMRELLATAQALGIDDPAAALLDDSEAIAEVRRCAEAAEACEAATAALLAPWGGSLDMLSGAVAAAERDVERLRATLSRAADSCSKSHWTTAMHRAATKHPRLWPDYASSGRAAVL